MNQQIVDITTMRADHQQWQDALARWRREIDGMQSDNALATARLDEMRKLFGQQSETLAEHARALSQIGKAIEGHRAEMAQFSSGGRAPQDVLGNRHQRQAEALQQQQAAHQRCREQHESLMQRIASLSTT